MDKPHKYYPGVLITNHAPTQIRVKKFFDPKVGIWKIILNIKGGKKNE